MGTVLGRVLVIDDDPFMLKIIRDLLERAGFRVLAQETALGARQVIVRERIDACVIDWNLPQIQGDEVVRLLRTWEDLRHLPVLLITGAPDPIVARIREELPEVRVLSKENLRDHLVLTLGAVVGSNKTQQSLPPVRIGASGAPETTPPMRESDLVPHLLTQLNEVMPLANEVWEEVMQGNRDRVTEVIEDFEQLAGQARLLALEEAANLMQALAETLRCVPDGRKVPRDARRAIDSGLAALTSLAEGTDGTFALPPEPLVGALRKARVELSPLS